MCLSLRVGVPPDWDKYFLNTKGKKLTVLRYSRTVLRFQQNLTVAAMDVQNSLSSTGELNKNKAHGA